MFEPHKNDTGTRDSRTVALLVVAFVFSPAALVLSRPLGYISVSLAVACTALCLVLAWVNWARNSRVSIASLETPRTGGK